MTTSASSVAVMVTMFDIFDRGAISGVNSYAVDINGPCRRHEVSKPRFAKHMLDGVATFSLALSTRAEARLGSASRSLSKPLAIAAKHLNARSRNTVAPPRRAPHQPKQA